MKDIENLLSIYKDILKEGLTSIKKLYLIEPAHFNKTQEEIIEGLIKGTVVFETAAKEKEFVDKFLEEIKKRLLSYIVFDNDDLKTFNERFNKFLKVNREVVPLVTEINLSLIKKSDLVVKEDIVEILNWINDIFTNPEVIKRQINNILKESNGKFQTIQILENVKGLDNELKEQYLFSLISSLEVDDRDVGNKQLEDPAVLSSLILQKAKASLLLEPKVLALMRFIEVLSPYSEEIKDKINNNLELDLYDLTVIKLLTMTNRLYKRLRWRLLDNFVKGNISLLEEKIKLIQTLVKSNDV